MARWQERRNQRRQELEAEGKDPEEDQRRANATPQQRKARSENRDPDQSARMMAYMGAMRTRMTERGITPPGAAAAAGAEAHNKGEPPL